MNTNLPDLAALEGRPVTTAHVRACNETSHLTHLVDGTDSGVCPRCGFVKLSSADLAENLVERVWERFDLDIDDFASDLLVPIDAEEDPAGYAALLIEFASRLFTPEALREAAVLAESRNLDGDTNWSSDGEPRHI